MIIFALIVHGLVGVALLGAITHQTLSAYWPSASKRGSFVRSLRAVNPASYSNAVVVLYCAAVLLGGLLYPAYRLYVRTLLEQLDMKSTAGLFELKEHFAAVGLGTLPAYWYYWRPNISSENYATTRALTAIMAFIVWWNFLIGHILNNTRGFGM